MLGERVLLGGVDHAHSDLSVLAQVSNAQFLRWPSCGRGPRSARPRPRAVCEARVTSPLWAALVRARCAVRCASRVLRSWIMPPTSKRPVRGHAHAATDHARQRATMQRAIINGQRRRRQAGRSKRGSRALGRRCRPADAITDADEHLLEQRRTGVRPLVRSRALQFRPVRTRQRAAHGMCTGLDSLMALAQYAQECACPLRTTEHSRHRHRRRHP